MTHDRCEDCTLFCKDHPDLSAEHKLQEKRIEKIEEVVKEIPQMQAKVHLLMYIIIATMTILISISGFSFFQLVEFKKIYFAERQKHEQLHSNQSMEREQRYINLINKLGDRISLLEARNIFEDKNKK